jgi:hypothetical protein
MVQTCSVDNGETGTARLLCACQGIVFMWQVQSFININNVLSEEQLLTQNYSEL